MYHRSLFFSFCFAIKATLSDFVLLQRIIASIIIYFVIATIITVVPVGSLWPKYCYYYFHYCSCYLNLLLLLQYSTINTPLKAARREFHIYYLGVNNCSRGILVTQICHWERQWTWLLPLLEAAGLVPVYQHHLWTVTGGASA